MSTPHHYRKDWRRTARRTTFRVAALLLAAMSVTPAWGDCPETLTLAEMVECFGAQGTGGEAEGPPSDPPEPKAREDVPPSPPQEPVPQTDADC